MSIQDINLYLKKHFFLVFRYKSEYYTLMKRNSLFGSQYSLVATDGLFQQRNSLEELCEQVYISKDTLLIEAIKHIEIPALEDPAWRTYEAVKHCSIVHRNEINFSYNGRNYWIAHTNKGFSHLSDDFENTQMFNSCSELFENARIDGKTLKDIWGQVIVYAC